MSDIGLADALPTPPTEGLTIGTVTFVDVDGLVIDTGLAVGRAVAVNSSWTPAQGDVVVVDTSGSPQWVAFGVIRTSYGSTQALVRSWSIPYDVNPVPTGGGVGVLTGTRTISANATGSWRTGDGWSQTAPYQGTLSTALGYYRGCWFYGVGAFSDLAGKTCTRMRVFLRRGSGVGDAGALPLYVATHASATQPAAAPTMTASAVVAGSLTAPGSPVGATFDLPVSFGQQLIDGRARGLLLWQPSRSYYLRCMTVAEDALSGQITLDWSA